MRRLCSGCSQRIGGDGKCSAETLGVDRPWSGAADEPDRTIPSRHLHHSDQVTLAATPKRSGPYGGLLAFSVPTDGHYRISAGSPVWIEVLNGRERVEPALFEMQTGCPALFKTIQYRLRRDVGYWLELSANTSTVSLLLSPEMS